MNSVINYLCHTINILFLNLYRDKHNEGGDTVKVTVPAFASDNFPVRPALQVLSARPELQTSPEARSLVQP